LQCTGVVTPSILASVSKGVKGLSPAEGGREQRTTRRKREDRRRRRRGDTDEGGRCAKRGGLRKIARYILEESSAQKDETRKRDETIH